MRKKGLISALGLVVMVLGLSHPLFAVDKDKAKQWFVYANGLYGQKQYDKAVEAYANALKADNTDAGIYQGLGNCYYAKGDKANAVKYYKYALQLNPGNTRLASFISTLEGATAAAPAAGGADPMAAGNAAYGQRNYDGAIASYNQALSTNPNNAKAYQGLGNCYYAKGDKVNAAANYKRALDLDPNNTQLKSFLAAYAPEAGVAGAAAAGLSTGEKDWISPAWRSAILPGWGQFYNDEGTKGLVIGGVTWGLLAGVVGTYSIGSSAKDKYMGLGAGLQQADYDTPYSQWEQMANLNHMFYYAFGVAWTYGIIDAVWNAHPAKRVGYAPKRFGYGSDSPLTIGMIKDGFKVNYDVLTF